MKPTLEERSKVASKLAEIPEEGCCPWSLSYDLFGDFGIDIYDFNMNDYNFFLDNVSSLEDLLKGLEQLSPLADDALEIAKQMANPDFYKFKKALQYERQHYKRQEKVSKMPSRYYALLIPNWFVYALPIADKCKIPLGGALIRCIESDYS